MKLIKSSLLILTSFYLLFAKELSIKKYIIEPFVVGSYIIITNESNQIWNITPTKGAGLRLPIKQSNSNLIISFEGGKVYAENNNNLEFNTLLTNIDCEYELNIIPHFALISGVGIANMLISRKHDIDISKPFAGESENEFGVYLGLHPTLIIKNARISYDFSYRSIFSSPKKFNFLALSLSAGWRF